MRNQGTGDTHLVGLIYGYQDSQNYYEVVISAIGTVKMRTVMNGIAVDEVPAIPSTARATRGSRSRFAGIAALRL